MKIRSLRLLSAALFLFTTGCDAVTKHLAEAHLLEEPIRIIPGWVSLRLAYNRGVAFSAFEDLPHWVLGIGALVLLLGVLISLRKLADKPMGAIALALVAAGGICNAIDRLSDGRVTDMISVWRWPVFNIADTGITIGVALLLLAGWKKEPVPAPSPPV